MPEPNLYPRGRAISLLNRWISLGVGGLFLALLWGNPKTQRLPTAAVATLYALYNLIAIVLSWSRPRPWGRWARVAQNVVDAVVVGLGAYLTGGLESPFWLLLYPHVVTISLRGGLMYAMSMGVLDAGIVMLLALQTPQPLGPLHALTLLWCALMGGLMSGYLQRVQARLHSANEELSVKNDELLATVAAHEITQKKQEQAMARLSESEARYRGLLERIQEGVLIIQDGCIAYANQVFADMVGDTPQGLLGTDFRELAPPEDRKDLTERYRRWEQSQAGSGELESRVRTRKGEILLVSVRAGSVDFGGKRSVISTIRDITREKRMELEVKGHAERLAAINEIANAVNLSLTIGDILEVAAEEMRRLIPFDRLTIALLDEEGSGIEVVAVGAGAPRRQRAGFTRESAAWAFKRPISWCHGGDGPPPPHLQELLAEPDVVALATIPLLSKDRMIGCMNLGRLEATPFSTWDLAVMEPVARHIAIAMDNARLLEAVRLRGQQLESLLEIGRGILERLELVEILPLVTRSVNQLMGTHCCLLLLKSGSELLVGAQEGLEPQVVAAFKGLQVGEGLSGWVAREGRPLSVVDMGADPHVKFSEPVVRFGYRSYLCVPLKRGAEVLGTLEVVTKETRRFTPREQELMSAFADGAAVAIDNALLFQEASAHLARVTEANLRLKDLDHLRQQYLRNVSHEFRTPLTVIKGYAEYLRDTGFTSEKELADVMNVMVESSDRVIEMVDTLIEVSRVEQGTPEEILQVQTLDLEEVALSCVGPFRHTADRKRIALDLDFPSEPLKVEGDSGLLHQVVRKLLDNALKYSPEGARVVVRGRKDGDALSLEVEDSGIGIAPEHLPRIFEKFYMVDGGIARRSSGTGVGLYLVREIVRLHNGTVEVQSLPGKGSVFSVRLPQIFEGASSRRVLA
jgi:PAS domain S-box-containing protein